MIINYLERRIAGVKNVKKMIYGIEIILFILFILSKRGDPFIAFSSGTKGTGVGNGRRKTALHIGFHGQLFPKNWGPRGK
ncbi:MAG: hypothetical protein ABII06_14455 [Pseudomonadota bacterium]